MELPRYLDGLLDKESVALLSRLPASMKDQVLASVKKVIDPSVSVKANRAVRYALVVAAVDTDIADEVNAGEHECLEQVERLFRLHGCDPDHTDDASAAKIYAAGRAARQRIASSLTATEKQYQKSLKLIRRDRDRLPAHVQLALNEQALESVHTHLITFLRVAKLSPDRVHQERPERALTRSQRVLLLWDELIPAYRGKWDDMLTLAHLWRISKAADVYALGALVSRARQGRTTVILPPGTGLLLAL